MPDTTRHPIPKSVVDRDRADKADAKYGLAVVEIENSRQESRRLEELLEQKRKELEQKTIEIDSLLSSSSWKITAPFRFFAGKARKLLNIRKSSAKTFQSSRFNITEINKTSSHSKNQTVEAVVQIEKSKTTPDLLVSFLNWYSDIPIYFEQTDCPDVSIIIPVYGCLHELEICLKSIIVSNQKRLSIQIILIEDRPSAPVINLIPESPGLIRFMNEKNLGFLHSCNKGAELAEGKYLCLLNSDTIVASGWLNALVDTLCEDDRIGLVGSMLLSNNGLIEEAGWNILSDGSGVPIGRGDLPILHMSRQVVDCVTGACFMISTDNWRALQGFDPQYAPAYYEEFDLAFRAKEKGLLTMYEPRSRVVHLGAKSYGTTQRIAMSLEHRLIFLERFKERLKSHPSPT